MIILGHLNKWPCELYSVLLVICSHFSSLNLLDEDLDCCDISSVTVMVLASSVVVDR